MKIIKTHLTTKLLKELHTGEPCRYCDTEITGLQIWVGARTIAFYLRKRKDRKEYTVKLGNWPDITLAEARQKALDRLGALANYGNIDAPSRQEPLFRDAIEFYLKKQKNIRTKKNCISAVKHLTELFDMRIKDITRGDLEKIHLRMKNTPIRANFCVKLVGAAINSLSKELGLPPFNITYGIQMYPQKPRMRFLTKEELPSFFAILEKYRKTHFAKRVDILYMLLYTGARKMNVCNMSLEHIDANYVWTIPAEEFKGKREQRIQLGAEEIKIVEKYRCGRTSGKLFTTKRSDVISIKYFWAKICEEANLPNLRIHDLRRTLGTWMLSSGAPIAVVSKKLGHASIHTTEMVYAHIIPDVAAVATEKAIAAMHQNGTSSSPKSEYSSSGG